jgi:hypothetical protein
LFLNFSIHIEFIIKKIRGKYEKKKIYPKEKN